MIERESKILVGLENIINRGTNESSNEYANAKISNILNPKEQNTYQD